MYYHTIQNHPRYPNNATVDSFKADRAAAAADINRFLARLEESSLHRDRPRFARCEARTVRHHDTPQPAFYAVVAEWCSEEPVQLGGGAYYYPHGRQVLGTAASLAWAERIATEAESCGDSVSIVPMNGAPRPSYQVDDGEIPF